MLRSGSDEDDLREELLAKERENEKHKYDILSDSEKQAVMELIKEMEEVYEPNRNPLVTAGECIYKYMYEDKETIISNGAVTGFALMRD
jgi:hypothetical protein